MANPFVEGAAAIFAAAEGLEALASATYHSAPSGGSGTYDPTTGTAAVSATEIGVSVFFAGFRAQEIDGVRIRQFDRKAFIEAANLDVTPKLADWIEVDGTRWEVKENLSPPSVEAVYVLLVRAAA